MITGGMVLDGLSRHLSKLRQATTTFNPAPQESLTWMQSESLNDAIGMLVQTGERVRDTITKFSLVVSSTTTTSSIKSISDELRAAGDTMVAALGVLAEPSCGAGGPLMDLYSQQVRAVLRSTEELVKHSTSSPLQDAGPRTGVVWAACEGLSKLPKSNKVAYRRSLLQHQAAVRDTLREFQEMLEEQEGDDDDEDDDNDEKESEGRGEASSSSSSSTEALTTAMDDLDLLNDEFFGSSDALKEWEKINVERCLVALGHCGRLLKALLGAIDEATDTAENSEESGRREGQRSIMKAVAQIEESCQGLAAAVVNAADALYPPQVSQELESQLGLLVEAAASAVKATEGLPQGPAVALCHQEGESIKTASAVGVARPPSDEEQE